MNLSKCSKVKNLFILFLENEINGTQKSQIETHLSACPACRQELENTRKLLNTVKTYKPNPALNPDYAAYLLQNIKHAAAQHRPSFIITNLRPFLAGALTCFVLLAGTYYFSRNSGTTVQETAVTIEQNLHSASRAEFRKSLDANFENNVETLTFETKKLNLAIAELVREHNALDKRYAKLETSLKEKQASLALKTHTVWKSEHAELIKKAREIITSFEKLKKEEQLMEAAHETVSFDKIAHDHELFDKELTAFKEECSTCNKYLEMAKMQTNIIGSEYDRLLNTYTQK
ncbi:MAG: hypothetical protein A2252_04110 [Elusimicrobia bacterium RIFOXYA2_FULL_39_19]|nr:MAG: hypothetical protein A2252_04110 [Elusimicrobia bacterium RIFOXYA2_FULL_39_19]